MKSLRSAVRDLLNGLLVGFFAETAAAADGSAAKVAHANGIVDTFLEMTALGSTWVFYLLMVLTVVSLGDHLCSHLFFFTSNAWI